MKPYALPAAICGFVLAWASSPASAATALKDANGAWNGGGKAVVKTMGQVNLRCSLKASGSDSNMRMNGKCRAGVFSRTVGFTLKSAGGNRFTGTYTGAAGTSRLSGRGSGNRLNLAITWAKPLYGDSKASLTIVRTGPNSFTQTVTDKVDGKNKVLSNLSFRRK